jgi:hypothetical protein
LDIIIIGGVRFRFWDISQRQRLDEAEAMEAHHGSFSRMG